MTTKASEEMLLRGPDSGRQNRIPSLSLAFGNNQSLLNSRMQSFYASKNMLSSPRGGNQSQIASMLSPVVSKQLDQVRPQPRLVYLDEDKDSDSDVEEFTANPAEDIPRNRLVEKLVRGL